MYWAGFHRNVSQFRLGDIDGVDFRLKLSHLLGWFPSKCEPVSAWKYPRFPYC
jgi:hypothetical protein